MAIQEMPKSIREMTIGQLEAQAQMTEEQQQEKLLEFLQQTKEAKGISRQYIQDLYRFFKLWKRHRKEEEDIFDGEEDEEESAEMVDAKKPRPGDDE